MNKLVMLFLALIFMGNLNAAFSQAKPSDSSAAQSQITALLNLTAEGWNQGDLQKYLSVYVPEATEMTADGPKGGKEYIEKTMREGFWKTGKPAQILRYENVEVRMLGKKNALVTGQYVLSGNNKPDRRGWFTTVWMKTKGGWRMIHDHS